MNNIRDLWFDINYVECVFIANRVSGKSSL